MSKIFITGSAGGLGLLAAKALARDGHQVTLHARNRRRGDEALREVPAAAGVLTADLSDPGETRGLAEKANGLGAFDAVIHNAGVYRAPSQALLNVNILAPYILTCLMRRPARLIYLSSGMHLSGSARVTDHPSYADTKLFVLMLAKSVARYHTGVYANAVDPGWVPTEMGGPAAPDDLAEGYRTQVWLAAAEDPQALVSGQYFYHGQPALHNPAADDISAQDNWIRHCALLTGTRFS